MSTAPDRTTPPAPGWRRLLDPESLRAADELAKVLPQPMHTLGVEGVRKFTAPQPPPRTTPVASAADRIAGGTVPVRVYRPHGAPAQAAAPCLLYLHGGGFITGSLDGVDEVCRRLSTQAGCVVVSADYRLAPEHLYPAALDDTRTVHTWLVDHAADLGIDAARIAVGGDSAGGNLAAALCLDLRDRGLPQPVLQLLAYPGVGGSHDRPSWTEFADAPVLTSADAQWFWRQYMGDDQGVPSPLAAPLLAESLSGLAPAHILTAEVDPLRDNAEAYADRLAAAGVPVQRHRYQGVYHGFFTEPTFFTKGAEAVADAAASLRAAFAGTSLAAAWRARVERAPDAPALAYFDGRLTARELDAESDALAVGLAALGTGPGDRIGIHLQNIPQYAVLLLALWKLGATALVLNPMYRRQELRRLVDDAGATGLICADVDAAEMTDTLHNSTVAWLLSTSARAYQHRDDPRVFADPEETYPAAPDGDLLDLIARHQGERPPHRALTRDAVALLTYTSGTTGPPKGAMNTHGNLLAVTSTYADWIGLAPGDVAFAMAPLFHITGAVVNATVALLHDTTLVLTGRFHPAVALDAFAEHGVTFTIGSITAYNALAQTEGASREHFATAKTLYSGGAPVPPATVARFEERFGPYLHNGYGMTETTSAVIAVPPGVRAPVHAPSGTLSIGRPLPHVTARVIDPSGTPLPPGEQGELELSGPQIVPGYWNKPEATAAALPGGRLRTGDVAIVDADGWVYLVDRLKDQINTSGYKVWPREVEDALCAHPAVLEAAVVGEPDGYRGETVVAYVSLAAGSTATPADLATFTRDQLAAYKVPRTVHIVPDLPKTQTGKIRRNVLRDNGIER